MLTDVRLFGGPTSNKGTVEIGRDNGPWETTCGIDLGISDVTVICRYLGFAGASRAITDTPYGQNSDYNRGLLCNGGKDICFNSWKRYCLSCLFTTTSTKQKQLKNMLQDLGNSLVMLVCIAKVKQCYTWPTWVRIVSSSPLSWKIIIIFIRKLMTPMTSFDMFCCSFATFTQMMSTNRLHYFVFGLGAIAFY